MADYQILIEGFDPTSLPDTPDNSQLLQLVRAATFADDIAGVILADAAPDVATYPDLARFIWHETAADVKTGNLYWHNGATWTPVIPAPGTLTGSMFVENSFGIDLLDASAGAIGQLIRVSADNVNFEYINPAEIFEDNTLSIEVLQKAPADAPRQFLLTDQDGILVFSDFQDELSDELFNMLTGDLTSSLVIQNLDACYFLYYDDVSDTLRRISPYHLLLSSINELTEELTDVAADDKYAVIDADAPVGEQLKFVTADNILPDSGVTADTYEYPASITVDEKGRITAISSGESAETPIAEIDPIPAAGTNTAFPNPLSGAHNRFKVMAQCTDAELGYNIGQEVEITSFAPVAADNDNPPFVVLRDSSTVRVIEADEGTLYILRASAPIGQEAAIDRSRWKLCLYEW